MFSFHRPKIFKSASGCCICRAKSSSSRFTRSHKYESYFSECFDLSNDSRSGDICNACVLLVKRFINRPANQAGQTWSHVVDARSGPGSRSMMRLRKNRMNQNRNRQDYNAHAASSIPEIAGEISSDEETRPSSRRRSLSRPIKVSPFLDLSFWRRKDICCGTIFLGTNGEVLIDPSLMHPCRRPNSHMPVDAEQTDSSDGSLATVEEEVDSNIPVLAMSQLPYFDTVEDGF